MSEREQQLEACPSCGAYMNHRRNVHGMDDRPYWECPSCGDQIGDFGPEATAQSMGSRHARREATMPGSDEVCPDCGAPRSERVDVNRHWKCGSRPGGIDYQERRSWSCEQLEILHGLLDEGERAATARIVAEIDDRIDAGRGCSEAWPEAMALDWCKRNIVLRGEHQEANHGE